MPNYNNINNGSSLTTLNFYNVINIAYAWDFGESVYGKFYTYPTSDTLNPSYQFFGERREVQLNFPAIYSEATAAAWAQRYYAFWAFGVSYGSQEASLSKLGDQEFDISAGTSGTETLSFLANRIDLTVGKKNRVIFNGYIYKEDIFSAWP